MLEAAQRDGKLKVDSIICEPTSGNTRIGLALVGRLTGYNVRIAMPDGMSEECKKLIKSLGADPVLTADAESLTGAVECVERMAAEDDRVFVPQQFKNPANPQVHYEQTARERWDQMGNRIDRFVAGVGSSGTLQGVGRFLKEQNKNVQIVAVEPENCSDLLGHEPGRHQIQGIGYGFIPDVLDVSLVDGVVEVSDEAAIGTAVGPEPRSVGCYQFGSQRLGDPSALGRGQWKHRHGTARPGRALVQHGSHVRAGQPRSPVARRRDLSVGLFRRRSSPYGAQKMG